MVFSVDIYDGSKHRSETSCLRVSVHDVDPYKIQHMSVQSTPNFPKNEHFLPLCLYCVKLFFAVSSTYLSSFLVSLIV